MEYYDRKGYSNREELDQDEELEEEEEDKNYNIINTTNYLSPSCYNNNGSSSSPSPQTAEAAINFMDLSLTNPKDDNKNNDNDWPPGNEREHMFDKVVTPSDVGKLNRLVIPKQHAEKYFPLDASANEKGLLLNFVDRAGKPWRFRYSYWNSSQSYVMTKGWSRFVKDKKLNAGDVVSFQRSVRDTNVLYIDWRRRPPPPLSPHQQAYPTFWGTGGGGGRFYLPSMPMPFRHHHHHHHHDNKFHYNIPHPYHHHHNQYQFQHTNPYQLQPYHQNGGISGSLHPNMVIDSVPVVPRQQVIKAMSPASNKRLRLFGVNMECSSSSTMQEDEEGQILASTVASLSPRQQKPVELRLLPANYGAAPLVVAGADDQVSEKGKSTSLSFYLDP